MVIQVTQEFIERLKKLAERRCYVLDTPEFAVVDMTGSNVDDAYSLGSDDGETSLARDFFKEIEE